MANIFQNAKSGLKKTLVTEKNILIDPEAEKKRNQRLRAVDLESWYDRISEFTYPTLFVDLTPSEAKSMIEHYWILKKENDSKAWKTDSTLMGLKKKMDDALEKAGFRSVFAKLSSRSPKDARLCQQRAKQLALQRLTTLPRPIATNDLVTVMMSTGIETLEMSSTEDILEMFLTSDRVCEDDLVLALNYPQTWTQHIVLRKWISIPIQYEFRGYVVANRLTGLSQYFNNAFFPEIPRNKEKIVALVRTLFEKVKGPLALDPPEYVIDIAVDLENEKAYVIELNPFGPPDGMGTGTPLFDLSDEADAGVLFGRTDFEFRIETAPTQVVPEKYIRGPWKTFYQENNLL